MYKYKILPYFIIAISIMLCVPSIIYLVNNKTVDGFDAYDTYTLQSHSDKVVGTIEGIVVIGFLLIMGILYLKLIKNEKNIFKNKKQIFIFIIILSFIFLLILPYLSSDIYYYIGDSWLSAKYGENPYYTTVFDLQKQGINDEILRNTGHWKKTTSIYGPLWTMISTILVSFSFGNVTLALFIFKIANLAVHIINCCLIYKITKSNKYLLLYGINPLILLEFLGNVHNDIYLILFLLLALYFLIKKKNVVLTILFLTLSISIKYSTVLIVPFILIYCFKDEKVLKRILYCIAAGLSIIALVVLMYLLYFEDYTIFTNMLVQGKKYNQSILLFLILNTQRDVFNIISKSYIPIFLIIYTIVLSITVLKKDIKLKIIMRRYNILMLIFILGILATFQKWYILWLFPTIIWQTKDMRKFIIYLSITSIIPSINYFIDGVESFRNGNLYSTTVLCIGLLIITIERILRKIIRQKKEKKCQS